MTLPIGLFAQTACIWEATARKPGNVHRYYDFNDVNYVDFVLSAAAIAPVLDAAWQRRVGRTILEAVRATRYVASTNTNLGILLLLTPLAAVPATEALRPGVARILQALDIDDARAVFEAMRLARPGGLGRVAEQDIKHEPTQPLRQIMALAATRDTIARQYVNGFREIFDEGVPALIRGLANHSLEKAIVLCHVHLLARHPDSLIARKRGPEEAEEASRRAADALGTQGATTFPEAPALERLDAWLRAEGHGRNPGTTADLVTACLFVALREGQLTLPWPYYAPHRPPILSKGQAP